MSHSLARPHDQYQTVREVAERLQVKPGSAQYRQLREDIKATYSRWARPLKK